MYEIGPETSEVLTALFRPAEDHHEDISLATQHLPHLDKMQTSMFFLQSMIQLLFKINQVIVKT